MIRTARVGQSPGCCAHAGSHGDRQSAAAPPRNCLLLGFMESPLDGLVDGRERRRPRQSFELTRHTPFEPRPTLR